MQFHNTLSTKSDSKHEGSPCTIYSFKNCPLPFPKQWTNGTNAGFSEADEDELWLPIHEHYATLGENVAAHEAAEYSFLKTYRELVTLMRKKVTALQSGFSMNQHM